MDVLADAKRSAARALEAGTLAGPLFDAAATIWAKRSQRALARPLSWPDGMHTVAVGGATLGGSYKTPTAIAVADRLARAGLRVALIGHGYRARPERARTVRADDDVRAVGDEAIVCARALDRRARVIVAPARQEAIDFAAALGAEALVFDGVLQARPRRFACAILALDAARPFGAGRVPPLGDLRAEVDVLRRHADLELHVRLRITGARPIGGGAAIPPPLLASLRLGLATSVARPERVVAALAAAGIEPAVVVAGPDHAPPPLRLRRARRARVDAWLLTEKCAAWARRDVSHLARQDSVLVLEAALDISGGSAVLDRAMPAP